MKKTPVSQRQSHATPASLALLAEEATHPRSLTPTNQAAEGSSPRSILHDIAHVAIHASEQASSASLPIQTKSSATSVETSVSTRPSSHYPQLHEYRASGDHSFASLAPTRSLTEAGQPHQEMPSMQPTEPTEPTEVTEDQLGVQPKSNLTGLPDSLKAGIERFSGFPLDDVRVHYHSPKPAEVGALAYTQGTEIHVGPGQEQHIAHEAWHVVQQKQGRVKPTLQVKGMTINNDEKLEQEANVLPLQFTLKDARQWVREKAKHSPLAPASRHY